MKTSIYPSSVRSEIEARQTTLNVVKPRKSIQTGQNTLFNYIIIAFAVSTVVATIVCAIVSPANSY